MVGGERPVWNFADEGSFSLIGNGWAWGKTRLGALSSGPWSGVQRPRAGRSGPRARIPASPTWGASFANRGWTSFPSSGMYYDDLASHYFEVLETIENPECVMRGNKGSLKATRNVGKKKWLVVIYREISKLDAFVITAYFLDEKPKGGIVWKRYL